jgi:hypothetical protein
MRESQKPGTFHLDDDLVRKRKQDAVRMLENACFYVHEAAETVIESLTDPFGRDLRDVKAVRLTVIPWYGYDRGEIDEIALKLSEIGYKIGGHENLTAREWGRNEHRIHIVPA